MKNTHYQRINFDDLNEQKKRYYNYHKVSSALADYGFFSQPLNPKGEPVDFIARHQDEQISLSILLKSSLTLAISHQNSNLHIAFYERGYWYVYPHDEVLAFTCSTSAITNTTSWQKKGVYHFPRLSEKYIHFLKPWRL